MNFCPGSKIQLMEKPQDMTELLQSFIDKNRVNVS
jgi:hypothetical protein